MHMLAIFAGFMLLFSLACYGQGQDVTARDEIQVLIDVSGSMKQNDPHNQRIDASKLLINLLPENVKVRLWLFAEKTQALISTDAVNADWKQQALKASNSIHSRGLYTNIEEAIQTVLQDGFAGNGKKHLILLTDGFVDVSKDILVSADSRERILSDLIPQLQQRNVNVETIALSAQADQELLSSLALATGGWTETAQSAEQLQRTFLKMLLKAAPRDSLPLDGNQFAVDAQVKEFSILAFKKNNASFSKLISPGRKMISKQSIPANAAWLDTTAYDLITVKQPEAGTWQLEAASDPDNQVMIMTDLKMQMDELANFIGEHDSINLKVYFTEKSKPIVRADFVNVVNVTVAIDQQEPQTIPVAANQPGYFALSVNALKPGKHVLKIVADGKTFQRQIDKEFGVIAESVRVEKTVDLQKRAVTIKLLADTAQVNIATLVVEASANREGQKAEPLTVHAGEDGWSVTLADLPVGTQTTVNFTATGQDKDGKPQNLTIMPVKLDDATFAAALPETPSEQDSEHQQLPEQLTEQPQEEEQTDWLQVIIIVVVVNVLFIGIGFVGYRTVKNVSMKRQQRILERLA
jgi:hypothetical protein